jgi:hypothetical protein
MRTGFAHLPLHGGAAPRYLFERMVPLACVERGEKVRAFRRLAEFCG